MKKYSFILLIMLFGIMISCKESDRYSPGANDSTPPGTPQLVSWEPLYGGARIWYTLPADEDLLSIDAEYTNTKGEPVLFTSSFYLDSIDVLGFGDTQAHKVNLYGVDRAGNRSKPLIVEVTPLEPAVTRVLSTLTVKPGFSSFLIDWTNELQKVVNVYVHYKFNDKGTARDILSVFSSNAETDRKFITGLVLGPTDPIEIEVQVEDQYGNITAPQSFGSITLLEDIELPKNIIRMPEPNDSTITIANGTIVNTGVPAFFGNNLEGRNTKLIDGIIDRGDNLNFFHTAGRGRTGFSKDGNVPFNIIMDLGAYYQLSRVITVQRHTGGLENVSRGQYYRSENCGEFRLWVYNEITMDWDSISTQRTPIPSFTNELQWVRAGEAGDMAYFYPDDPQYTVRTRWFRYECLHCFDDNYSSTGANCMSELTLYGKKAD
ncbi:MAG: DUF4959 domain-containing protein [Tannerella sp.]|jgi:hypothetical protein|nr:DUF4959 domain-containing protein [Tannerella sp.]